MSVVAITLMSPHCNGRDGGDIDCDRAGRRACTDHWGLSAPAPESTVVARISGVNHMARSEFNVQQNKDSASQRVKGLKAAFRGRQSYESTRRMVPLALKQPNSGQQFGSFIIFVL